MPRPFYNQRVLTAVVAQDLAFALDDDTMLKADYTTVYAIFGAGTTAGTFVVEASHDPAYTGVWANLATLVWAAASSIKSATIVGAHNALRVRVSVAIVNGSADAWIVVCG